MQEDDSLSNGADAPDSGLGSTIFARLHPSQYLSRFLSLSLRPDGRTLSTWRPTTLAPSSISSADGSCMVRMGGTIVVAGVKAEVVDTTEEEEGGSVTLLGRRLVPNLDLGPMASSRFRAGPPGKEAQVLTHKLYHILDSCPPLDASSLTIEEGQAAWCLYVDVVCISYDGNVLDAALLSILGSLQNTRLPVSRFDVDQSKVICSPDRSERKPLEIISLPLSSSFGIVDGNHLLTDPNAFEASLLTSEIVICLDVLRKGKEEDLGDIVSIFSSGSCSAIVSHEEAKKSKMDGKGRQITEEEATNGASGVRIFDEALIELCLHRTRRRLEEMYTLIPSRADTS